MPTSVHFSVSQLNDIAEDTTHNPYGMYGWEDAKGPAAAGGSVSWNESFSSALFSS